MANRLEIVFIIDKSGSMSGLEKDTVGGINSIIKEQKEKGAEATVTTVFFNNMMETIHRGVELNSIELLSEDQYRPSGMTALLDAIGNTISMVSEHQSIHKADKTLVVITTDGMENSSREFNKKSIKTLIKAKEEAGWEFIFLGANIDAIGTANDIGISRDNAANYKSDSRGSELMFCCVARSVECVSSEGSLKRSWKKALEEEE